MKHKVLKTAIIAVVAVGLLGAYERHQKGIETSNPTQANQVSRVTNYQENGKKLYNKYINTSKQFRKGFNNGNSGDIGGNGNNISTMTRKDDSNPMYEKGWIIGAAKNVKSLRTTGDSFGSKKDYRKVIPYYHQGVEYAKNNSDKLIMLGKHNMWIND